MESVIEQKDYEIFQFICEITFQINFNLTSNKNQNRFNLRLTKLFFVTRLTKGDGLLQSLPIFSQPNPL